MRFYKLFSFFPSLAGILLLRYGMLVYYGRSMEKGKPLFIFAPWFLLLLSIFYILFSSPNLSRRRLDVYCTSTHGVALVRISDSGLKRAASGSLKIQDANVAENHYLGTMVQLCRAIPSQLRHVSTIGKKRETAISPPHVPTIW